MWKRAWADTLRSLGLHSLFKLVRSIFLVAIALLIVRYLGGQTQMREEILWIVSSLAAIGVVFLITFLFHLIRAPVYDKWERANEATAKPKPIPLPNRGDLIKTLGEVERTACEYIPQIKRHSDITGENVHTFKVDAMIAFDKLRQNYKNAIIKLEDEERIAGKDFQAITIFFKAFLNIQEALADFTKSEDTYGARLEGSEFKNKLKEHFEVVLRRINEISQPNSDKEGSQPK